MKIVLASHHFPPSYTAGAEQYAYRVASWLQQHGHDVEVVCIESVASGGSGLVSQDSWYDGIMVHRLHMDLRSVPDALSWTYQNPLVGDWFRGYLSQAQPDLVHFNSTYLLGAEAVTIADAMGFPIALTLHDYWFLCPLITLLRPDGKICAESVPAARCVWCMRSAKRRYRVPDVALHGHLGDAFVKLAQQQGVSRVLGVQPDVASMEERRAYLKTVLATAGLVISPSHFLLDKVAAYGFHPRRMVHLPFGLAQEPGMRVAARLADGMLRIGYLGQIAPHKGVHVLIEAYKMFHRQFPAAQLVVYGDLAKAGAYGATLSKLAHGDASITFPGPYPNGTVGQVLAGLDVVVVPSIWYENRPTVIVEAFAHGKPVIGANLGGIAELIHDGRDGLLFEPADPSSLASKLARLRAEPGLLPALTSGVVPPIQQAEEMAELERLYRQLLAERKLAMSIPFSARVG
jgi:glycosyltransferase involved in cell wall biosynthesis